MMESINFRTAISASLLRTAQAALSEIPHKLHQNSRANTKISLRAQSISRTKERDRQRRLFDDKLVSIAPPLRSADLESNPRQWLLSGNPRLANLVTETIGDRWKTHLEDLQQLAPLADNPLFQLRWRAVKQANKHVLANYLYRTQGIKIDVDSLFDLQLQPIAGNQRQLLNILHIIALFDRIKQNPEIDILPRTFIFGNLGKIAPSKIANDEEAEADLIPNHNLAILVLIQSLTKIIAADIDVRDKLQIVYIPESAEIAHKLYAAADLTQHIAPAAIEDLELSKLQAAVNGVISIGSMGKTNHWLKQTVGEDNCFRFGLAIPEIALFKEYGYDPYNYYKYYPEIRQTIDRLSAGYFTPDNPNFCRPIVDNLLGTDEDMVMAEYIFYTSCQSHISETYRQESIWTQMSILNVAGVG